VVTLHSPEEQAFYGKTLEEALAWCLEWLIAKGTGHPKGPDWGHGTPGDWGHEIGIGPFPIRALKASESSPACWPARHFTVDGLRSTQPLPEMTGNGSLCASEDPG
jgi:hypothetical protein